MSTRSFITKMFSSDTSVSSKRILGAILIVCGIIMGFINNSNFETFLIIGASMVGLETVTNIFKKNE